jgi:hypothetical protein
MPQNPGEQPHPTAHDVNVAMRELALSIGRRPWTADELARYAALNEAWLAAVQGPAAPGRGLILVA